MTVHDSTVTIMPPNIFFQTFKLCYNQCNCLPRTSPQLNENPLVHQLKVENLFILLTFYAQYCLILWDSAYISISRRAHPPTHRYSI